MASFAPHFGEEAVLVGRGGSCTIFFSGCNLACAFCQNWEISQAGAGRQAAAEELAGMMLALQDSGCHNINFVTQLTSLLRFWRERPYGSFRSQI
ncbi:MAG TPA: 4Fe-4S cluster-binding domain-containing protein [Methanothrix sp.]|nr:4Fe-4S cluster-binding domain-containing protein [Methanothrix sp.]